MTESDPEVSPASASDPKPPDSCIRLCTRVRKRPSLNIMKALAGDFPLAERRRCETCNEEVWYDPGMNLPEKLRSLPEKIICTRCAAATPGIQKDLVEHMGIARVHHELLGELHYWEIDE
jgi:hypothetical protein